MGETPIVIHPDAALTLNYLDTQRLPLTQLHLATAVALLARMVGQPDNAQELALRQAQLTQYLHQLYRDVFIDWSRRHPIEAENVCRLACAVHGWRIKLGGATPLEAFVDLRDRRAAHEDEALAFVSDLTEQAITHFVQDPATERLVAQTACAFYAPEEFPTHGALVELLAYARLPEHNRDEIDRLATLLRAWTADGQYGRLFDGVTNVSLQRKIAHFELGLVPEQAVELKAVTGLLISGFARQRILALPRAQRKRIIFEEVARFLDVPGGEQIVAESYAQLRKHNCWAVSIVQQYARFKSSRVRPAVIGNAKQFFLMRQSDRGDLADLATDLALPESAVEAIQRYPLPEQLADERYSSLCYFMPTTQPPRCGTLRTSNPPPPMRPLIILLARSARGLRSSRVPRLLRPMQPKPPRRIATNSRNTARAVGGIRDHPLARPARTRPASAMKPPKTSAFRAHHEILPPSPFRRTRSAAFGQWIVNVRTPRSTPRSSPRKPQSRQSFANGPSSWRTEPPDSAAREQLAEQRRIREVLGNPPPPERK